MKINNGRKSVKNSQEKYCQKVKFELFITWWMKSFLYLIFISTSFNLHLRTKFPVLIYKTKWTKRCEELQWITWYLIEKIVKKIEFVIAHRRISKNQTRRFVRCARRSSRKWNIIMKQNHFIVETKYIFNCDKEQEKSHKINLIRCKTYNNKKLMMENVNHIKFERK